MSQPFDNIWIWDSIEKIYDDLNNLKAEIDRLDEINNKLLRLCQINSKRIDLCKQEWKNDEPV